ncbi:hypothetical protein VPHF99_0099 [Vibrio phage F99]
MAVYIVNFENYFGITKIGKADNIVNRLKELEKYHGEVVNLIVLECESSKESLMWEDKIHTSFLVTETFNPDDQFFGDFPHKVGKEGCSEFFMHDDVLERLTWIEAQSSVFGRGLKYYTGNVGALNEVSFDEYLLSNLFHNKRWAFHTFWKLYEGQGNYDDNVVLFNRVTSETGRKCWLKERKGQVHKMQQVFEKDASQVYKYFPNEPLGRGRSYLEIHTTALGTFKLYKEHEDTVEGLLDFVEYFNNVVNSTEIYRKIKTINKDVMVSMYLEG